MRISSKVRPGCSKGDQGISKVGNKEVKKSSCLNEFYDSVERLQIACSELLQEVILLDVVKDFTVWLEEASHAFAGFYSVITTKDIKSSKGIENLCLSLYTLQKVEHLVSKFYTEAGSKEFQRFSSHPTLNKINKVRVESRNVERLFNKSIEEILSKEKLNQSFSNDVEEGAVPISLIIDEYQTLFNRLSSIYWIFSQKEMQYINNTNRFVKLYKRVNNILFSKTGKVQPLYWSSKMPELPIMYKL